jgi:U3 small nucleolar RNA-associated protein 21
VWLWDVRERVLAGNIAAATPGAAAAVLAVPGQPMLLTAGGNAVAVHVFDAPGTARVLRSRMGPQAPPTAAVFASRLGVLCGGPDGLFGLDAAADRHTHRLSDAKALEARTGRPLPAAVAVATSQARERDWANVISAHAGEADAVIWRSRNKASEKLLHSPRFQPPSPVTVRARSSVVVVAPHHR